MYLLRFSFFVPQVYIDKFDQVDEKIRDALQADIEKYAPGKWHPVLKLSATGQYTTVALCGE